MANATEVEHFDYLKSFRKLKGGASSPVDRDELVSNVREAGIEVSHTDGAPSTLLLYFDEPAFVLRAYVWDDDYLTTDHRSALEALNNKFYAEPSDLGAEDWVQACKLAATLGRADEELIEYGEELIDMAGGGASVPDLKALDDLRKAVEHVRAQSVNDGEVGKLALPAQVTHAYVVRSGFPQ